MAIMLEVVGGLLVVALMLRGAIGFWADYRKRTRDRQTARRALRTSLERSP